MRWGCSADAQAGPGRSPSGPATHMPGDPRPVRPITLTRSPPSNGSRRHGAAGSAWQARPPCGGRQSGGRAAARPLGRSPARGGDPKSGLSWAPGHCARFRYDDICLEVRPGALDRSEVRACQWAPQALSLSKLQLLQLSISSMQEHCSDTRVSRPGREHLFTPASWLSAPPNPVCRLGCTHHQCL